jgi:hypothetical protein
MSAADNLGSIGEPSAQGPPSTMQNTPSAFPRNESAVSSQSPLPRADDDVIIYGAAGVSAGQVGASLLQALNDGPY